MRRYIILVDRDDPREGEVRLGGKEGDDGWEGGQLIFTWRQHFNLCGKPPARVERLVNLANEAASR